MTYAPATHALVNPKRFGLTPVREVFGEWVDDSRDLPLISGNFVRDAEGSIRVFVGLTADRKPYLVDSLEQLDMGLEAMRVVRLSVTKA